MKIVLLIIGLFTAYAASSQDITGIWRGSFNSSNRVLNLFDIENRYKCEVQIEQLNNALNGVTYSYKTTVFYGKAVAEGSIDVKKGEVSIRELKTVELKMETDGVVCIMTYHMKYSRNGEEEFLEGTFESVREKDQSDCGSGTVSLRKVVTSDFHKEPFLVKRSIEQQQREMLAQKTSPNKSASPSSPKLRTPQTRFKTAEPVASGNKATKTAPLKNVPPVVARRLPGKPKTGTPNLTPPASTPKPFLPQSSPNLARVDTAAGAAPEPKKTIAVVVPKVLSTRENELVKVINVSTREVQINIYDNGTIDHDTISVYLDQKLVVSKQMLTTKAITVKFTLDDDNTTHELVMVAENLGDIPPNTSLMVVKAGEQTIEVRITSTESRNAVVAFRYKKP